MNLGISTLTTLLKRHPFPVVASLERIENSPE